MNDVIKQLIAVRERSDEEQCQPQCQPQDVRLKIILLREKVDREFSYMEEALKNRNGIKH